MKQIIFLIILTTFLTSQIVAQPWMNKLYTERLNKKSNQTEFSFFEIQKAFNEYWKDKEIEKGKGWKPFKRWEWFMQSRIDKNGYLDKTALWKAWQEKKLKFPEGNTLNNSNWKNLGPEELPLGNSPTKGLGRINCIAVDPNNNNIIWVGSPSGGLWKSTNDGNSWITNTDFLDGLGVSSIIISPFNSNIMYLATGDFDASDTYSIGILKSTDSGQTWFLPNNSLLTTGSISYKLAMHPSNENVIYACSKSGIIKSIDGGINWINTTNNLYSIFFDFIMDKSNPAILYAAAYDNGTGGAIIKSTNGGGSWIKLTNGLPVSTSYSRIALALSSSNPNIIYSIFSNSEGGLLGVYKSTDSGNNWALKANSPNMLGWTPDGSDVGGQSWYDLSLIVNPVDPNIVYLGGVNIWKTIDGGSTWKINAHWYGGAYSNIPIVHADIHTFEYIPNTDFLLCGCDGGLFKTTNGGTIWQDLSNGLGIQQFYRIGGSAQVPNIVYGGAQDNGTSILKDGIWTNVGGGDGMECAVDYTNHDIGYVSSQFGSFARTTDGGKSFTGINEGIIGNSTWTTPFLIHPTNPEILYRTTTKVYKSTNKGNTWNTISGILDRSIGFDMSLTLLKVSKSNPNYIYASSGFNLFKTTNGGNDWVIVVTPNMNNSTTSDIAISPTNPEIVYLTDSNPWINNKILKSTNAGNSWTNITGGIPNGLPVNCIIVQDDFPNDVYVGTDIGVFYSETGGGNWQNYDLNLPNVIVSELEINNISGKIRAATYGRGLWESPLNKIKTSVAVISPNGGENIISGNNINISWVSNNISNIKLEFTTDNGGIWSSIVSSISAYLGSYSWAVPSPGITKTNCKIKISSTNDSNIFDESDNTFTITVPQYMVNTSSNPLAGGTISGSGTFYMGQSITLTASANNGYTFQNWTENGIVVSTNITYSFIVNSNKNITANFLIKTYTLTTVSTNGTVTTNPNQTSYNYGMNVILTATPNTGYSFTSWSGDATGSANPITVTMDRNKAITANFIINTYSLTINTTNGTVTKNPDQTNYNYGSVVQLTATPNTGYIFSGWSGNATGSTNPLTITMDGNKNITANFTTSTHTLTVNATNGTVTKNPNQANYNYGSLVQLTATPNTGYTFSGWSGDASGTTNPLTITMNGNKNITANFIINTYALTINAINGTVTKNPDQVNYNYGAVVQLTATPSIGYTFTGWSGNATGSANPLTIIMDGNKNITANFTINSYTLTVTSLNGTVVKNPDQTSYIYGSTVTLTATPSAGYTFMGWSGDASGSTNPLTVTMNGNKNITANFTINKYTVTLTANPSNGGTVSGNGIYDHGGNITVIASAKNIPGSKFQFSNWTENGNLVSSNSNYTFIITSNRNLVANFQDITAVNDGSGIPTEFSLSQNYPNPFNPTTTINYAIPKTSFVIIKVFNSLGKELTTLVNEEKLPGNYQVVFNVESFHEMSLPSGVYFYTLKAGNPSHGSGQVYFQTKKLLLLK